MSKLSICIERLSGQISSVDKARLLALRKEYKDLNVADEQADTLAIVAFNNDLIDDLNMLKIQVGLQVQRKRDNYKNKENIRIINLKYDDLEKIQAETHQFELKDSDLEYLLSDEKNGRYDNATIVKAIKEANRLLKLPNKELFKELQKYGIFNLGRGEKYDARPDLKLSTEEYNNTLRQLASGKYTKTVEWLNAYLNDLKKSGELKLISGVGGTTDRFNMPLYFQILGEKTNAERGLAEIEEKELLEKEAAKNEYEAVMAGDQYQKKSTTATKDVQKVVDRIQKSLPKFKVSYDDKLKAAGKIKGNEITINPFYAGKDTPIHEAGHALIDFIGYSNKVVQKGIEQLKSTSLWKETKQRYPELNDEMLGKEVLAEAIGREGADIFDSEVEKGKFKQVLDYIFDWLKRKLGLEKNVAKSLAKQIISGVGTKNIEVKKGTKSLFDESVKMFYKIKDSEGAAKKRNLAEQRRSYLEANPSIKYIEDNIKSIYKQLEQANKLIKEGDCI